jgi:RHS repeat-associated protein
LGDEQVACNLLSSLSDASGTVESYDYLGFGTVVRRGHPGSGVDLSMILKAPEAVGDAGDPYNGLDRFGRVVDQRWRTTSADVERVLYGYDRNSNRMSKTNSVNSAFSEAYTYDNLNQLSGFNRNSGARTQNWNYDAAGNWNSVTTNGVAQTRTANKQNEITSVSGATTPTYDANGNMTGDETGRQFVYDAWNRLKVVKNSGGSTLVSYTYDAGGRRVAETASGTTTDLYYSAQWQVLEEAVSGTVNKRYVWSPVYVDALILRDRDTNADGTLDERLWAMQDANWNVVGLANGNGVVVERYAYDPYGAVTVMNGSWMVGSTAYGWRFYHQGKPLDTNSGLYNTRRREDSPTLGRWTAIDPIRYNAGDTNLYRYENANPLSQVDPSGLAVYIVGRKVVSSWIGWHYSIVVVSDDRKSIVTYDGAGPSSSGFPQDNSDRPIPQRNWKPTIDLINKKYLYTTRSGKTEYILQEAVGSHGEDHLYHITTWKTGWKDEVRALDYAFNSFWQLPYGYTKENSNTYLNVLLELAGMMGNNQSLAPSGAVGWDWKDTGYGPKPLTIPNDYKIDIDQMLQPGMPSHQTPKAKPTPPSSSSGTIWGGGACFVAGTQIETSGGFISIETVKAGDMVRSWNERERKFEWRQVVEAYTSSKNELYFVRGCGWEVICSPEHPFLLASGKWRMANELTQGDSVKTVQADISKIIEVRKVSYDKSVPVFNFQVSTTHTYCVGYTGVVVHNKPP